MGSPAEPLKGVSPPALEPVPGPVPVTRTSVRARELPRLVPIRGNTALNAAAALVGRVVGTARDTARKVSAQTAALHNFAIWSLLRNE